MIMKDRDHDIVGREVLLQLQEARERRPAREVLASVVDRTRGVLEAGGDLDRVTDGFERLLGATGAVRQRAAYERTGSLEGVVDDVLARTADSWASPERS